VKFRRNANGDWIGTLARRQVLARQQRGAANIRVLLVPGLATNIYRKTGLPYYEETLDAMRSFGFEAEYLQLNTEHSVARNARVVRDAVRRIRSAKQRTLLLTHSKGGTDATAALSLYPRLRRDVVGLIAIQPAYGGSPVADYLDSTPTLQKTMKWVFESVFKGERQAVVDLTHRAREQFIARHPFPTRAIATVVVRSTFRRRTSSSPLWSAQRIMARKGFGATDGLLTLADQNIPGAVHITLRNLDHAEPAVRGPSTLESNHRPVDVVTRAFMRWVRLKAARR
jgi:hypothetical protein